MGVGKAIYLELRSDGTSVIEAGRGPGPFKRLLGRIRKRPRDAGDPVEDTVTIDVDGVTAAAESTGTESTGTESTGTAPPDAGSPDAAG